MQAKKHDPVLTSSGLMAQNMSKRGPWPSASIPSTCKQVVTPSAWASHQKGSVSLFWLPWRLGIFSGMHIRITSVESIVAAEMKAIFFASIVLAVDRCAPSMLNARLVTVKAACSLATSPSSWAMSCTCSDWLAI